MNRLLSRRRTSIPLWRYEQVPSGYVGTVRKWQEIPSISADMQEGDLTVAQTERGAETAQKRTLYIAPPGADIRIGDGALALKDDKTPLWKVKALVRYENRAVAVIERV